MDALEIKEVAGLRAELDARATTQYVDGSDRALQLQLDEIESDLVDLENEQLQQENRLLVVEQALPGKAAKTYVDAADAALQQQLSGKAALEHSHTSTSILDFQEAVQDAVAAFMRSGANVTLSYDDANNTYTVSAAAGDQFDPERTRDAIGAALLGLGLIDVAVNDAGDTISISTRATQNAPDAQLRDRATHTGQQPMASVTGLQGALDAKSDQSATTALSGRVAALEQPLQAAELLAAKQPAWSGLGPRAALLKLINEGSGSTTTPAPAPALAAPQGLQGPTAADPVRAMLSWQGVAGSAGYRLQRAQNTAFTVGLTTVYEGSATSFTDQNVQAESLYYYRVQARGASADADSPFSAAITVQMPAAYVDPNSLPLRSIFLDDWSSFFTYQGNWYTLDSTNWPGGSANNTLTYRANVQPSEGAVSVTTASFRTMGTTEEGLLLHGATERTGPLEVWIDGVHVGTLLVSGYYANIRDYPFADLRVDGMQATGATTKRGDLFFPAGEHTVMLVKRPNAPEGITENSDRATYFDGVTVLTRVPDWNFNG